MLDEGVKFTVKHVKNHPFVRVIPNCALVTVPSTNLKPHMCTRLGPSQNTVNINR